jgi:hypothetical protein
MFYVPMKLFWEKMTFYVAYAEMAKFGTKYAFLRHFFFCFFAWPIKMSVYPKILHEHIERGDIHVDMFFIFLIF